MPDSNSDDKTRSYLQLVSGSAIGHCRTIEKIGAALEEMTGSLEIAFSFL